MVKHVLVPVDGSEPAEKAIDHVRTTTADSVERVTVIHVVDPAEGVYSGAHEGYYDRAAYDRAVERGEDLCSSARDDLEEALPSSTAVETAVLTGEPARTIVNYADEHDIDHVVIGSHGREGVSRILLGSVAETVTRRAAVPVTIVR
ncbi:universal stress protein [Natrarchaeobius oligotrophus]|uniref:Universal stress protein n=1 Tax=Natrarchaeobius chitinivorans TaxID=1679083 RepID=A0A3N6MLX8_NATCH|nr:universal stress protein [Natrarchaeobius chitinivorans]RQH02515.1 universal stress protein [Natrarchaeobius chitinivorans]